MADAADMSPLAGDPRSQTFGQRLEPCLSELLAGARLLLRDAALAEDALQSGILSAYRSQDTGLDDGHFRARLWRCVAHAALNLARHRQHLRAMESGFPEGRPDLLEDLRSAEDHQRLLEDPDRFLEEVGDDLRSAVLDLPDPARWVFLLRSLGEFSYREIADLLSMPIGSVMSTLHRARERLRRAILTGRERGCGR